MVWFYPLKLSVTEDGLTAETGLTVKFFEEVAHYLPHAKRFFWEIFILIGLN